MIRSPFVEIRLGFSASSGHEIDDDDPRCNSKIDICLESSRACHAPLGSLSYQAPHHHHHHLRNRFNVAHVRDVIDGHNTNPVAVQMINYALSHARSQKSAPQDDTSSLLADRGLQLLDSNGKGYDSDVLEARIKALKGLVELVVGNVDSAESFFQGTGTVKCCSAATCAWGQVDRHTWATLPLRKKILTQALTRTEENSVLMHPRVGGILTCIALMFRQKATLEHSSASFDSRVLTSSQDTDCLGAHTKDDEKRYNCPCQMYEWSFHLHILRLHGIVCSIFQPLDYFVGGYAEVLTSRQNRKDEGERLKAWAEGAWRNNRLSLAEAIGETTMSQQRKPGRNWLALPAEEAGKKHKGRYGRSHHSIIPSGAFVTMEFCTRRVRLYVDTDGKVVRAPRIG
ncbi:unnamed protein product [Rhodiola kirilowii]